MEFGASSAYKKIDVRVGETLKEAAQVLKSIQKEHVKRDAKCKKSGGFPKKINVERKSVTVTSCSVSSTELRDDSSEPKATIRTPRDAKKQNRGMFFPQASIYTKSSYLKSPSGSDCSSYDPITTTPDSLFPSAIYIPASKGSKIKLPSYSQTQSSQSVYSEYSARSPYRKHMEKLATEPLCDISYLKGRDTQKAKPDSLFPKATYNPGTGKPKMALSPITSTNSTSVPSGIATSSGSSGDTSSLICQPLEFVSTDGRIRMMLQPVETPRVVEEPKQKPCAKKIDVVVEPDDFPIVPKQLTSSHKLKTERTRTKFSTKLVLGGLSIDLSGIFNGNALNQHELSKLIINGQSYSI